MGTYRRAAVALGGLLILLWLLSGRQGYHDCLKGPRVECRGQPDYRECIERVRDERRCDAFP
jgi:hypothetical protein